ncbi:MAG: ABC transporter ATP-binding protein [Spirochaetaceae bacterium]|nr:MAG: ABC transporter ATP-binding protein [Spirochaetaceae bacterium]
MHVLEVKLVSKRFADQERPAVDAVSFRVEPGEIFGLLGPSGCGKTTTLRIIAGFERPDGGIVAIRERNVTGLPPEKRKVGFVFQDYALFPHLTVLKNVMFAMRSVASAQREQYARGILCMVGLTDLDDRMPDELSGGQQQRVALARALAARPQLLLMDEPFSNLDAGLRDATRREVRLLLKAQGLNAILVTHDQEEALSFCDRLAVMNHGHLEQVGTPEEVYHHPGTPFVAQFLGRANLLSGNATGDSAKTELGDIAIRPHAHGPVLLSLRPEHLSLMATEKPEGAAEIVAREFRGHDVTYRVHYGGRAYLAHTEYTHSFFPGQSVRLVPREPAVVLRTVEAHAADGGREQ